MLIRAAGGDCVYLAADVSATGGLRRGWSTRAVERTGALDVLVNNAALAGGTPSRCWTPKPSDCDAIMAVNLRAPFLLCRAAVARCSPSRWSATPAAGSSTSPPSTAWSAAPGHFAYAVSKAGLVQLTRQIAVDYGRDGILCNAVAPGKIVTGTPGDLSADEKGLAYVQSRTPFPRLGQPEDVAAAVAFLARRRDLRQRREPDGRRRLDGVLSLSNLCQVPIIHHLPQYAINLRPLQQVRAADAVRSSDARKTAAEATPRPTEPREGRTRVGVRQDLRPVGLVHRARSGSCPARSRCTMIPRGPKSTASWRVRLTIPPLAVRTQRGPVSRSCRAGRRCR